MASQGLPEDVVIEILVRLPVKSIQRFKSVSKSWRDLIRSSMFIDRHHKRDGKQRVLLLKRSFLLQDRCRNVFSFHDPDFPQASSIWPDLSIPIPDDLEYIHAPVTVHGPCNGLVCVSLCETVVLCNPALRQFRPLPPRDIEYPEGYLARNLENGFGFDPNTGAYKFVQFCEIRHRKGRFRDRSKYPLNCTMRIDLYNSASNSWRQIDPQLPLDMVWWFPCFQLFFNGAIHWSATLDNQAGHSILCFDMSTDAFRVMDYPDDLDKINRSHRSLMVLNESLAMVLHQPPKQGAQLVDIWVMNEYGVTGSWTKQFVIGPYSIACALVCLRDEWLLCESENGQLIACALHKYKFEEFQLYGREKSPRAMVYEESLISLEMVIPGDGMHE
ncbi:F-box protein CPR1-like [Henckelia pumila]|uniref:F-box protein CPR1-like n=1 Tax=Henckelia pumila TaxID=405737 RepID=UPI003C6E91DC